MSVGVVAAVVLSFVQSAAAMDYLDSLFVRLRYHCEANHDKRVRIDSTRPDDSLLLTHAATCST